MKNVLAAGFILISSFGLTACNDNTDTPPPSTYEKVSAASTTCSTNYKTVEAQVRESGIFIAELPEVKCYSEEGGSYGLFFYASNNIFLNTFKIDNAAYPDFELADTLIHEFIHAEHAQLGTTVSSEHIKGAHGDEFYIEVNNKVNTYIEMYPFNNATTALESHTLDEL